MNAKTELHEALRDLLKTHGTVNVIEALSDAADCLADAVEARRGQPAHTLQDSMRTALRAAHAMNKPGALLLGDAFEVLLDS